MNIYKCKKKLFIKCLLCIKINIGIKICIYLNKMDNKNDYVKGGYFYVFK